MKSHISEPEIKTITNTVVWGFSKHPAIVRHVWFLQNDIGRVVIVIVIVEGRVVRNILTCVTLSFLSPKKRFPQMNDISTSSSCRQYFIKCQRYYWSVQKNDQETSTIEF